MKPTVVTLCGSTRFKDAFVKAQLDETLAGRIVLTIGCAIHSDPELFGHFSAEELEKTKKQLDTLHMRKIEMSDEILVLNVENYVGESTGREIAYAYQKGLKIRWLIESSDPHGKARQFFEQWAETPQFKELTNPPRTCPYPGCENPFVNKPPCALCYE